MKPHKNKSMLDKDSKREVVYESPTNWDQPFIWWYLKRGYRVWVIEPVYAYHYTKKVHFFPRYLPNYVNDLIYGGKVNLLSIEQMNTKYVFFEAGDKAVETVETVFGQYRKDHDAMLDYVSDTVQSKLAENAFKSDFCNRLAEFYSMNMFLGRVSDTLKDKSITFYPRYDLWMYSCIKKAVDQSKISIFNGHSIQFPLKSWVSGFIKNIEEKLIISAKILIQYLGCITRKEDDSCESSERKECLLGVAISSPGRQLRGNQRGPDFLIDGQKICPEDVVYFCRNKLDLKQKQNLEKLPGNYCLIPRLARFFSHKHVWKKLLRFVISKNFLTNANELQVAQLVLFNYFVWKNILRQYEVKNFITHCDFGAPHIGRNIAFNQAGTQTWYYTDSMNFTGNFYPEKGRHPFWTYLYYDHFVTWNESIAEYFKKHLGSIGRFHIVGCLWAQKINEPSKMIKKTQGHTIAIFDSGYTLKGIGSFEEGVAFAKDILKLADEAPDIRILFKPKLARSLTLHTDSVIGSHLIDQYDEMVKHPRIQFLSFCETPSRIIDQSDLVVSFPFTSTTFESISMGKPALWHDALGVYKDTPYGRIGSVTTHSYSGLLAMVKHLKEGTQSQSYAELSSYTPLFDPYSDGKAVERFRDILVDCHVGEKVCVT